MIMVYGSGFTVQGFGFSVSLRGYQVQGCRMESQMEKHT